MLSEISQKPLQPKKPWWQGAGEVTIVATLPSGSEFRATVKCPTYESTRDLFDALLAKAIGEAR